MSRMKNGVKNRMKNWMKTCENLDEKLNVPDEKWREKPDEKG